MPRELLEIEIHFLDHPGDLPAAGDRPIVALVRVDHGPAVLGADRRRHDLAGLSAEHTEHTASLHDEQVVTGLDALDVRDRLLAVEDGLFPRGARLHAVERGLVRRVDLRLADDPVILGR